MMEFLPLRHVKKYVLLWWWGVDRVIFVLLLLLFAIGFLSMVNVGVLAAERKHLWFLHFLTRQTVFLCLGFCLMLGLSFVNKRSLQVLALLGFLLFFLLLFLTYFVGIEVNASRRWISLLGQSLQPSEIIRPFFAIQTAMLLSKGINTGSFNRPFVLSCVLLVGVIGLTVIQPDIGMAVLICSVWGCQVFLSGVYMRWFCVLLGIVAINGVALWFIFPHFSVRVLGFFQGGDFQTIQSLGGVFRAHILGVGVNRGVLGKSLPEAHNDFIFSVIAEEYGMILVVPIMLIFLLIFLRGMRTALLSRESFLLLASCGLLCHFIFQAFIHMAVNLALLPNTGMTLPFISYGGSSLLSSSIAMGFLLSLLRISRMEALMSEEKSWK